MSTTQDQPRIDGSIHAPAPRPARQAYAYVDRIPLDLPGIRIEDLLADLGVVVLHLGDLSIHLHSEEQARALIEAAGKAAAMFATLKMRDLIMDPNTHRLHFIEAAVTL